MRKINPIALSVIGGIFIFTVTYILFWVLFLCLDSPDATQAAINTLGGYFGGIATLWAACVAAYLFNDWKVQHNTQIEYDYIRSILEKIRKNHVSVNFIKDEIIKLYSIPQTTDSKTLVIINKATMYNIREYIKELRFLADEYHLVSKDNVTYLYYLKYDFFLNEFLNLLETLFSIQDNSDRYNLQVALLGKSKSIGIPIGYENFSTTFAFHTIKFSDVPEKLESSYIDLMKYIADTKVKV